jgi:hypothetical protein
MSRFNINVHGLPLGDPHNPPGSSRVQNDPFTAAAVAASVMSAYSSYQQGQIQGKQLELKGRLEQTQYDRRAIQYQQKANQVLERLKKTNATLTAKGFAGGVDSFSGSTDIVRASNETSAGREFKIYLDDADAAIRAGDIALASNLAAAQQAKTSGKLDAATKLLMAGATAGKGGGFDRTSYNWLVPAPVETRMVVPT